MKAIDTNILLRFILRDDPVHSEVAAEIIKAPIIVPITVLMETEWVLRSHFRLPRGTIAQALRDILDLPTAYVEEEDAIRWALDRFQAGADLADMLHLVVARGADAFLTFDRGLAKAADHDSPTIVELLTN